MMSVEDNMEFERRAWRATGTNGNSSGPRYVLDTVLHHESNTDALYKAERSFDLMRGMDVLEVGCNCGGFCFLFAKTAKSVVGLDILTEPLVLAYEFKELMAAGVYDKAVWGESWCHPPDWSMENVEFVQGNGYDLPFGGETFGVVAMYSCIEHFPMDRRLKSVLEAKRVTRAGGVIIVSTITDVDNDNREAWLKQIAEDVHPYGLCQLTDILGYAEDAGLEVVEQNELWFGDKNRIKLAFVVLKKT